jgi:hypothetical protein
MSPDDQKRRAYFRKEFTLRQKILVNEQRDARLKNMSLGGMCFHSEEAHEVGNEIIVGNRLMSIFARVLACRPDTVQNGHGPIAGHEVRCEYIATEGLLQQEMLMELVLGEENATTA